MTKPDQTRLPKEPSMDEILASIRKIIADDVQEPASMEPEPVRLRGKAKRVNQAEALSTDSDPSATHDGGSGEDVAFEAPGLLSVQPGAEAAASFASLNHTIFSQNARTIEDLVRDMLKPMLQSWLDANLPSLVERLVRQEIERISGRN